MLLSQEELNYMAVVEQKRYQLQIQMISLLYQTGSLTASSLAKKLNISLPTVRNLMEGLIENSIVSLVSDTCKLGRKPFNYRLSDCAFHVFAVEVGHVNSRCAIINCWNQVVGQVLLVPANIDDTNFESSFFQAYQTLLTAGKLSERQVAAVGISMPGLIDSVRGFNFTIANELDQDVAGRLQKVFQKPVFVENDARMNALGESAFGLAREKQDVLVVNWSSGLGLGIIAGGSIISGSDGLAGEFSHIRLVQNGELCRCGKRGCLQTIASTDYLLSIAKEAIVQKQTSHLTSQFGECPDKLQVSDIIEIAWRGDEIAQSLLRKVSENLAWGLSILIQLNNPELIVINGSLAKAGELVKMPLLLALNQYCLRDISKQVNIEISSHEDGFGLLGVAVMIFTKMFSVG